MNRDRRNRNGNEEGEGNSAWGTAAAVMAGIAGVGALTGLIYLWSRNTNEPEKEETQNSHFTANNTSRNFPSSDSSSDSEPDRIRLQGSRGRVRRVPSDAINTNLNSLLHDLYVRYIAIDSNEFQYYYGIFLAIFNRLHRTMKSVDQYYNRYASDVSFAGSHYDGLRIRKPNEFDMDVVIGMPLNISNNPTDASKSDIILRPKGAGYIELEMGTQFKKLPFRDSWEINKTAYKWKDGDDYLLRSKFKDWFKSVVVKALNQFQKNGSMVPIYEVDYVEYTIRLSESGPAVTLIIENKMRGFKMDIDLVPALKFPEARWPLNDEYRDIPPPCNRDYWMVVPKPNKTDPLDLGTMSRSWRIALQYQEGELIYNCENLKQALRLMKKLRDTQKMDKIASYYIKTLFFWEVLRQDNPLFWRKNPAELFKIMVHRLNDAVSEGNIPYFWNENNNLIADVKIPVLAQYKRKLKDLIDVLDEPRDYKQVAKFLLSDSEFEEYNNNFLRL